MRINIQSQYTFDNTIAEELNTWMVPEWQKKMLDGRLRYRDHSREMVEQQ